MSPHFSHKDTKAQRDQPPWPRAHSQGGARPRRGATSWARQGESAWQMLNQGAPHLTEALPSRSPRALLTAARCTDPRVARPTPGRGEARDTCSKPAQGTNVRLTRDRLGAGRRGQ